jgi:uncharacterized membrane protein
MSEPFDLLREDLPLAVALPLIALVVVSIYFIRMGIRTEGPAGERILRVTGVVLSLLGLVVAGSVAIEISSGGTPQCIGGGGGCTKVEDSRYSEIFGIHMSVFGLIGYTTILGATLVRGDPGRLAGFFLTLFGFGFSLYLTYLEFFEIKALCQWCVASAIVMTMLFVVSTARMVGYFGLDPDDKAAADPEDTHPDQNT